MKNLFKKFIDFCFPMKTSLSDSLSESLKRLKKANEDIVAMQQKLVDAASLEKNKKIADEYLKRANALGKVITTLNLVFIINK